MCLLTAFSAAGADVDGFNEDNWSVLMIAVQEGHVDTAELLIRRGVNRILHMLVES